MDISDAWICQLSKASTIHRIRALSIVHRKSSNLDHNIPSSPQDHGKFSYNDPTRPVVKRYRSREELCALAPILSGEVRHQACSLLRIIPEAVNLV